MEAQWDSAQSVLYRRGLWKTGGEGKWWPQTHSVSSGCPFSARAADVAIGKGPLGSLWCVCISAHETTSLQYQPGLERMASAPAWRHQAPHPGSKEGHIAKGEKPTALHPQRQAVRPR